MKDLIERQAAIDALERSKKIYFDRQVIIGVMQDIVRNLPSAQPEIIWCRECKLRDTEYCNMAHGFMGMKDDDYCSYGERREVSE